MNNILSATKKSMIQWRMAIIYSVLFSASALGTCIMSALTGTIWSELDGQSKLMICIGIFVNWSGTMMALIVKAEKKISSGDLTLNDTPK